MSWMARRGQNEVVDYGIERSGGVEKGQDYENGVVWLKRRPACEIRDESTDEVLLRC